MIKIFNANDKDFSTAGNIIVEPIKCREFKKKSLNGWYIEVELPIKYKEYIEKDKLCVIKTKSKLNPQAFRIAENIIYTNRKISFTANHVMFDSMNYFLLDVRPTSLNGNNALNYINERTDNVSPFTIFSNVENVNTAYFIRKSLLEAWTIIEERWNGVFDADNWNISFLQNVGHDNGETIIYGKNMQSMEVYEDWSNVVTKICPVGYDGIMLPETYIESDVQYEIPYTKKVEFETDIEYEEQTQNALVKELREKATKYIEENKYPKISYTTVSNINDNMEIGDTIQVLHPLVSIKTEVLEYEYDVISKKIKSLTFGNFSRDVKAKFNNIKDSIKEISQTLSKQEAVINNQTNLINMLNKNGYVYIDENEILILDKLPKEEAENVWRFGLGGLGFSSNGYEGPFETAITIDGQINAKFITTGTMSVSRIEGLANSLNNINLAIQINEDNITSVLKKVDEQNNKISQVTQTLDELRSSISDIADLTVSAENYNAKVILENINESEPIRVVVRPVGEDISYLYPRDNLYPSDDLYLKNRRIRFATDTYSTEWELPDDLLYYDAENYDELILDYEGQSCIINKKVEYNADGSKKLLDKPITVEYPYPKIELKDGDYTVSLLGYNTGYLFVRLMSQNIYTTQFATKAEVGSQIKQTTQDINLGVNEKLKNYSTTQETNSAINLKANEIASTISGTYATKGELSTTKTEIKQTTDNLNLEVSKKLNNSDFTSANIMLAINNDTSEVKINADKIDIDGKAVHFKTELSKTIGPFTKQDFDKVVDYVRNGTELTVKEFEKYDFDGDGEIHLIDAQIIAMAINNGGYYTFSGTYEIDPYSTSKSIALRNSQGEYQAIISLMYNFFDWLNVGVLESSSNNGNITTSIGSGHASFNDSDLSNSITIGVSRGEDRRTPSIELYKNDNGQKTLSLSPEEINIQWGHVLASHNLYNNTSGSTGTITLSESSANFSYLEIFYGKNQSTLHSVKVVNPNGKRACLTLAFYDIANSFVQMQVPKAIISGTTIMKEATGGANIYSGNTEAFTANEVAIFKVVGYK